MKKQIENFKNHQILQPDQLQKVKGGDDKRPDRPPGGGLPGGGTLPNGAIWALTEKAGLL